MPNATQALPQHRFFNSGHLSHRSPPSAAAQAQEKEKAYTPPHQTKFPQKSGGWAKRNFLSDLGVEKEAPPAPPQQATSTIRYHSVGQRNAILDSHIAEARASRFSGDGWRCRSCGHNNTTGANCTSCKSFRYDDARAAESDRDRRRSWTHLKFAGCGNEGLSNASIVPQASSASRVGTKEEQLREERLAQTRDGRFVGFSSRAGRRDLPQQKSQVTHKSVSSRGVERQSISDYIPKKPITKGSKSKFNHHSVNSSISPYVRGNSRERQRKRPNFVSNQADDEDDRIVDKIERALQRKRERAAKKKAAPPTPLILPEYISITNLATALKVRIEEFGAKMRELGFKEFNNDHILDAETAGLIASEFNYEPTIARNENYDIQARPPVEDKSLLPSRPPVVTIMGHVDHGKTTLLDWLRKSSVAASEHGGITQHIGAFSVLMPSGRLITFLDTPGHAAFLSMRQRGANVTDIVILVVAADDSVKPQTLEALKHAQTAKVPIIVAVNKVDKEDANVDQVKKDLARYGVEIEEYGGDTQVVAVSGKTGQGMQELEDAVIALADVLDMRGDTDGAIEGWVLEATTNKAGRVATVLVSRGTIRPGDVIVAGSTWAKVRTLRNEGGTPVLTAGPGTPVAVDGWREQPVAGDEVLQAEDEQRAKSIVDHRVEVAERDQMAADMAALNETRRLGQQKREEEEQDKLKDRAGEGSATTPTPTPTPQPGIKEVFFIIKADVSGSAEAVLNSVSALGNSEVRPHVLRSAVGPVTEFDINHAAIAKGHVLSFNTVLEPNISRMAEEAGVQIIDHSIIYRLVDDVKTKLSEQLAPIITQRVLGEAEIAQIFEINVKRRVYIPIAGCKVRNGMMTLKGKVKVIRGQEVVYDGIHPFFHRSPLKSPPLLVPLTYSKQHPKTKQTSILMMKFFFKKINRSPLISQKRQKGRYRNAQGKRMRPRFRELDGVPNRGSSPEL
jgi:translation initiation factor IF-2